MSVLAAFMVPHPPMIVPEVGKGSEEQIIETTRAYEKVAEEVAALQPETIIITSPHSIMYGDYFHISPGSGAVIIASGDLSHKLQDYGPYGFAKEGPEYDKKIMDVCGRAAFGELFEFGDGFCENSRDFICKTATPRT